MKKLLISIRDLKAESWSFPTQAANKADAMRQFQDLVANKQTIVGQHPEDFSLFIIGDFDLETGILVSYTESEIQVLANGNDFVKSEA